MPIRFIKALFGKDDFNPSKLLKEKFYVVNQKDKEFVCFLPEKEKGFKVTFLEKNKALLDIDGNIKLITFSNFQDLVNNIYRELENYLPVDINKVSLRETLKELKNYRIKLLESSPHYVKIPKSMTEILENLDKRGSKLFKNKTRNC